MFVDTTAICFRGIRFTKSALAPVLFVNEIAHPLSQNLGEQRNIDTGGGTYVERDERRGIHGGTFHGPAIGNVEGGSLTLGGAPASPASSGIALQHVLEQVRQLAGQARGRGEDDLADDFDDVVGDLVLAIKAQQAGKTERYREKLGLARAGMAAIAQRQPDLRMLALLLQQL